MIKNYLSFDLENWYDSEFVLDKNQEDDLVLDGLHGVLNVLKKNKTKATFFVTGDVCKRYPRAVKEIALRGHEIASHSYSHKMLDKLSRKEVADEISNSRKLIKKIIGINPIGFRAPCWSIRKEDFWIYSLLKKEGYRYSSSIFPVNMGLYGSSDFPIHNFHPIKGDKFLEIPIKPFILFKARIPFSGGVYFRIFPGFLLNYFFASTSKKGKGVVLYLHPWEFCSDIPRTKTTLIGKVTTYYGIKNNLKKLDYILKKFKFAPLKEALKND